MTINSLTSIPYDMAISQGGIMTEVGTSMLAKSLDLVTAEMADFTKAMELSVNPNVGSNFDISI